MNYETETRTGYVTPERAAAYKRYHTRQWTWGRVATWKEQRLIERELRDLTWTSEDIVLDVPCGTGILSEVFSHFPFKVVASDISPAMMALARADYRPNAFGGLVQADIAQLPLREAAFACVFVLGFMHRVPPAVRRAALREVTRASRQFLIISYSVDSIAQRVKRRVASRTVAGYRPAPAPVRLEDLYSDFENEGLVVRRQLAVVPFLSSEVVFVLEKRASRSAS